MLTKIKDAPYQSFDGAKEGIASAGEADDLAANSIFLRSEGQRRESGLLNLLEWRRLKVNTGRANKKLNVLQSKRVLVVVSIFPRAEEEEKGQYNHISSRAKNWKRAVRSLGEYRDTFDDRNRDGFDSEWCGICSLPGFQGTLEPKVDGVGRV